ncbi:MAG: ATP:cob(I)alamin adenosyltransferase, partial [Acidobacteriota bacterium]
MPMHTVYLGAERFERTTPKDLARDAAAFFDAAFPTPDEIARIGGFDDALSRKIHARVRERLQAGGTVQDLRLDFEDAYDGDDAVEDAGTTGLGDGSRVAKTDLRVEAYGTVDEA